MSELTRVPSYLRSELEDVPHELRRGAKHIKLYVGGRMAAVLPRGHTPDLKGLRTLRASVRRAVRNWREGLTTQ